MSRISEDDDHNDRNDDDSGGDEDDVGRLDVVAFYVLPIFLTHFNFSQRWFLRAADGFPLL